MQERNRCHKMKGKFSLRESESVLENVDRSRGATEVRERERERERQDDRKVHMFTHCEPRA